MKPDYPSLWIEVMPPRGIRSEPMLRKLAPMRGLVSAVNLTDNALARIKMSGLVFAGMIQQQIGIPVVLNFSCRDRNLLALKSDLLGAAALGVNTVVALAGDRISQGTQARAVHHLDAIGLLRVIGEMNRGEIGDHESLPANARPRLLAGAVANPNRLDLSREFDLLERKARAGARFVITQPIFNLERAVEFIEGARQLALEVIVGVMPIKNSRMAQYLKDKVKDLRTEGGYFDRYIGLDDEDARRLSIAHSLELMRTLDSHVAGFNVMSGGGPSLAIDLIQRYADERHLRFEPLRPS